MVSRTGFSGCTFGTGSSTGPANSCWLSFSPGKNTNRIYSGPPMTVVRPNTAQNQNHFEVHSTPRRSATVSSPTVNVSEVVALR
ncbi:hypothetical protein D3C80_1823900 [compost metagenome]